MKNDLDTLRANVDAAHDLLDAETNGQARLDAYRLYRAAYITWRDAWERRETLRCDPHHQF